MSGRIPREFIDDILARTDVVELIDQRVPLKKAGKNFSACCPFHNEKSPSFSVSQEKQFYHCFGCGAHGNAISFLMEFERLEFVDAIEELAAFHGLDVPREQLNPGQQQKRKENRQQQQDDHQLLESITRFYQMQLRNNDKSEEVIDYLKNRGLSGEVVKQFAIGYAPAGWDAVVGQFGKDNNSRTQLIDLGMAIAKDSGRPYDRFRDRVMFPIRDRRGRTIGFGGRVMDDSTPKYLNSPETRTYHKGRELYGLFEARQAESKIAQLLVVEGYMDVVALAQHDISYAVASLGTATTDDQIQLMFRNTRRIICCYDGDRAGRSAAWRALENALPYIRDGYELKFMFLPDGEDPDSMVRSIGKPSFEEKISEAMSMSDFLFDHLMSEIEDNSRDARTRVSELAIPMINRMPEGVYPAMLKERLAKLLGIEATALDSLFKSSGQPQQAKKVKIQNKKTPVRSALALLLEEPTLAEQVPTLGALRKINTPGMPLLVQVLEICQSNPDIKAAQLVEQFRDTEAGLHLSKILMWQHEIQPQNREQEFLDTMDNFLTQYIDQRIDALTNRARQGGLNTQEKQELQKLLAAKN